MSNRIIREVTCGALLFGVVFSACARIAAGQVSGQDPNFDVISIKPIPSPTRSQMVIRTPPSGGIRAMQVTPRLLMRFAFGLDDSLIVGAPDWIDSVRFDVIATGPPQASTETTRGMVRSLLEDRFSLRSHHELRELPVYRLQKTGNGLGENLRATTSACAERDPTALRPSPPRTLLPLTEPMPCGVRVAFGHISGGGITLDEFSTVLTQPTGRPVVNRTGLAGAFDVVMNFTPEALLLAGTPDLSANAAQGGSGARALGPTGPSIFTAVREQLGLRLESSRAPIEVLVIDSIERPTPN